MCSSKLDKRHFRSDSKAKSPAEADAFVDVDRRAAVMTETRRQSTCFLAHEQRTDTRQMDLPAVRMAAQHQVAAFLTEFLDRQWIMGEDDSRRFFA